MPGVPGSGERGAAVSPPRCGAGSPEVHQEDVLDLLQDLQLPEHITDLVPLDALLLAHVLHGVHLLRVSLLHDAHLEAQGASARCPIPIPGPCRLHFEVTGCKSLEGHVCWAQAPSESRRDSAQSMAGRGPTGLCGCLHPTPAMTWAGGVTVLNPSATFPGLRAAEGLEMKERTLSQSPAPRKPLCMTAALKSPPSQGGSPCPALGSPGALPCNANQQTCHCSHDWLVERTRVR